jgi:hypothetical protein
MVLSTLVDFIVDWISLTLMELSLNFFSTYTIEQLLKFLSAFNTKWNQKGFEWLLY